ncbi:MAG: ribonuclease III [Acidaminococcales bacterium]|jgi:ribonuclease-3|nr:ribonuclease III [Acidaminococcales bacterium]
MGKKAERNALLEQLCQKLNIKPRHIGILDQALTHTSFAHEAKTNPKPGDNERLEFLGDAVLSMAVCTYIYNKFPDMPEGEMTRMRSKVVCESALAGYARALALGDYILLGKGEEASGGKNRSSILADALEAVIGACYIDCGWKAASKLAVSLTRQELDSPGIAEDKYDFKTRLQEMVQKDNNSSVSYLLLSESGPGHNKVFEMAVLVNNKLVASAEGSSKKEAEQAAAKLALSEMDGPALLPG